MTRAQNSRKPPSTTLEASICRFALSLYCADSAIIYRSGRPSSRCRYRSSKCRPRLLNWAQLAFTLERLHILCLFRQDKTICLMTNFCKPTPSFEVFWSTLIAVCRLGILPVPCVNYVNTTAGVDDGETTHPWRTPTWWLFFSLSDHRPKRQWSPFLGVASVSPFYTGDGKIR
jgi:hypothetical protein